MATNPQMTAPQGGAPGQGGASPAPSQAPANPLQILLARWYQTAQQIGQQHPELQGPMQEVAVALQKAQTAMLTQGSQQAPSQSPQY